MLIRVLENKNARIRREKALKSGPKTDVVSGAAGKGSPPPSQFRQET